MSKQDRKTFSVQRLDDGTFLMQTSVYDKHQCRDYIVFVGTAATVAAVEEKLIEELEDEQPL